ncbi:MAG TPA: hypothetical protein EYP14_04120, partial [Planctomycetaceae bacterium]|nr:hypothetical protein [Planctomycetaceae bacterium]
MSQKRLHRPERTEEFSMTGSLAEVAMLSHSRIPMKTLAVLCRSLGTMLHSGIDLKKAMDLAARKTGDQLCRQILTEIGDAVRDGREMSEAMSDYGGYFPDMVINMVAMAEQTGQLPEVLLRLADHYEKNVELRRTFLRSIAWPVFQLVAAILVIALLILVLGVIADAQGGEALDVLGLGLAGPSGAVTWLVCNFGTIAAVFVLLQV